MYDPLFYSYHESQAILPYYHFQIHFTACADVVVEMYTCVHAPAGGTNTDHPQSGGGSSSGVVAIAVIVVIALLALIVILAISIAAICIQKTPSIFVKVLLHVTIIHVYMYYSRTQQNTHMIHVYVCVSVFLLSAARIIHNKGKECHQIRW